ncbi:hypothetical protein [Cyanobium sp. Morenito 9A2]|uniref:hypothetical protein n=1 Tax=Cyanobium sp. Morenito 9A2 TaxID=2823718 RepID=UPI0020CCE89C|nr:hypothetical protein [Cyanobium sp. Morenito 9A2]MCP9848685.1 hypothetical protein [Cyanobium sp. Morenito 9A2]
MLRRLLLIPLLAPLLAVLLVAALNPRPALRLRLLVWSAPALPLGGLITLAAVGGALLSAGATALALRSGAPMLRRQARQGAAAASWDQAAPPRPRQAPAETAAPAGWSWPRRSPQDPPPTVSVPFRVIRKGNGQAAAPSAPSASAQGSAAAPHAKATSGASSVSSPAPGSSAGTRDQGESWESSAQDDW